MTRPGGKWRPSLWLVLGGALAGTLVLSVLGLIAFRYLGEGIGFRRAAVMVGLVIFALTLVPWWLFLRLLLRPLSDLSDFAHLVRLRPRQAHTPPQRFGTRELRQVGQDVAQMAEALQNREMTIRSYTDHVTHELKSPLTTIRAAVEMLEDSPDLTPGDQQLVRQMRLASDRMQQNLDTLRQAAATREASFGGASCLADIACVLELPARVEAGGELTIPLSREGLQLVLGHLAQNAAAHGARCLTLSCAEAGAGVQIDIRDDGTGISEGNRDRIFQPFFTTRREEGGTGMGLFIASTVIQGQGGTIGLRPGTGGAAFRIWLPRG
jgi:signal transduction histidine kinase